jgi:hypothetical protein
MNTINTDLQSQNIDVSHLVQPNGPVKADARVATKPEHVDFRVIRNESLIRLAELIEELKKAAEAFSEFKSKITLATEEARRQWYRRNPGFAGRSDAYAQWEASDPELIELPAVVAAKIRVQNLKAQLADAESELSKLQTEGTPRAKYTRALVGAWTVINAVASGLKQAAFEDILFTLYKTSDLTLIPEQAVTNARVHPDVHRWNRFRSAQLLDPLRTEFGAAELSTAHMRAERLVEQLSEIIKEA